MSEWLRPGKPGLLYASLEKPGKSLSAPQVLSSRHADPVIKTRSSSTNAPVCSGSGFPPGSASCKFSITESRCRGFGLPRLSYASRRPKPFRIAEGQIPEHNGRKRTLTCLNISSAPRPIIVPAETDSYAEAVTRQSMMVQPRSVRISSSPSSNASHRIAKHNRCVGRVIAT